MTKQRRRSQNFYAYLLITPGLVLVLTILVYPLIRGIISSFFIQAPASTKFAKFVGLNHYKKLFKDEIFIHALKNSVIWTIINVIAQYLIGLGIALILNKEFKGRGIFRSLILIPWVVPNIAAAMTWKWMYANQYGIINYILTKIGIISQNVDWLGSTKTAFGSVIITSIWKGIPFITIVLLAGLQSIDHSLYEAAKIDGASRIKTFRYITLPGIKEVSITTILLVSIWSFNQFDLIYCMTKGGPSNSTQIVPVYTYMTAFNFFNLNYAAAIGVIGLLIISVFSILYAVQTTKEDE